MRAELVAASLYFYQGIVFTLPSLITLCYAELPNYAVLGVFSAVLLPFSFKFVTAPLVQKYYFKSYGKRKTWMVPNTLIISFCMLGMSSKCEDPEDYLYVCFWLTSLVTFMSFQDIALDAFALENLKNSETANFYQSCYVGVGALIGSLGTLELIKPSFIKRFGFHDPLITLRQFIIFLSIFPAIWSVWGHLQMTEKPPIIQQSESFTQVVLHYRHYVQPKYRLCRYIANQFCNYHAPAYFIASFAPELIKGGFSKNTITALNNFITIPSLLWTYVLYKFAANADQISKWGKIIQFFAFIGIYWWQPTQQYDVALCFLIFALLRTTFFFNDGIIKDKYLSKKYIGLDITAMTSMTNLSRSHVLQLKFIDIFGVKASSIFGFIIMAIVLLFWGRLNKWSETGARPDEEQEVKQQSTIKKLN